jgi:transposase, IS5 family
VESGIFKVQNKKLPFTCQKSSPEIGMRKILPEQIQMGEFDIGAVEIELNTRDEIPQLLRGLQHLYVTARIRKQVFELLQRMIPDGVRDDLGRKGMDLWKILVLGTLRLCCNWDYDKLQEIANNHATLRKMLGHGFLDGDKRYPRQTLNDNLRWFTEEILQQINRIVVNAGHRVLGIKADTPLHARCDSFVVETDVHFPTDINLLWDALRKSVTLTQRACELRDIAGWRQADYLLRIAKKQMRIIQRIRDKKGEDNQNELKSATIVYIETAKALFDRVVQTLPQLAGRSVMTEYTIDEIKRFVNYGRVFIDQIQRRCLKGERIPHEEKIFSIFEPHTEWISKGKAGVAQELGLRVCILECSSGFVLHHMVMEQQTDDQVALPIIKEAKKQFNALASCSFDKGFHSPDNQEGLSKVLNFTVLPKKGKLDTKQHDHESSSTFVDLRRKHAAVESAINALENHGLDRVRDYGLDGFKRHIALAIMARNIQLLGRKLQDKELEKLKATRAA